MTGPKSWFGMVRSYTVGVVMRLTDQYVFLPESSQKVKHIKSHEKDTTVAWGYHKDVIIDIIIKTIIIHNIFL